MEITEILEKIKDKVDPEDINAIKSTITGLSAIQNNVKESDAKAGRILSEKKELQQKYQELLQKVEETENSGKSNEDKLKSELEKTLKKLTQKEEEINGANQKFIELQKNYLMKSIAEEIKMIDIVKPELKNIMVNDHFGKFNIDELNDEDKRKQEMDNFLKRYTDLIATEKPISGGGIPVNNKSGRKDKPISEQTTEERAKHLATSLNLRKAR